MLFLPLNHDILWQAADVWAKEEDNNAGCF